MINVDEIPRDGYGRPKVFLEEKCPVQELSIECQRERGASSALPPLYFLHVWWARRPLTASRAAIIGSLLPSNFDEKLFLNLIGIPEGKDPKIGKKIIDDIKQGIRSNYSGNKYGYKRAFTNTISENALSKMNASLNNVWKSNELIILDSFAGGGSIPFESVRMGFNTISNELNPVASIIEKATVEYPSKFGIELNDHIKSIGKNIEEELKEDLKEFFPRPEGELPGAYIWTRTVICPSCELEVPLSPNFWLDTINGLGYKILIPDRNEGNRCDFEIKPKNDNFNPDEGTLKRGIATCPRCKYSIDGEFISKESTEGRMGHQLAVVESNKRIGKKKHRSFRSPTPLDYKGLEKVQEILNTKLTEWVSKGIIPNEEIIEGSKTREPLNKGIKYWKDMFSSRQLLTHMITLEKIINYNWNEIKDEDKRNALKVYITFAFNKTLNYNSILSGYQPSRTAIRNVFDRHDFSFKWSYGELDGAGHLFKFGFNQIVDAYKGICKLINKNSIKKSFLLDDAASLSLDDKSVDAIVIDPPYYDNVMYAELSDFFYVWMKRILGDIFPNHFNSTYTDKDNETVANISRFKNSARGMMKNLAYQDYEAKMTSAFKECNRVLRELGVLTIMFTHKKVEAWDTLAKSILNSGFEITATWPIHTESEHSLNQAKKNAVSSTILLICRKRPDDIKSSWWEDIKNNLDEHVRKKVIEFEEKGLQGQDTFIACFGPALQILSKNWPVKTKDGKVISPQEALDRARRVVSDWFIEKITFGKATEMDKTTRFYILAWHIYKAREVKFDEINRLAISMGIDLDKLKQSKLLEKKGEYVRFLKPVERFRARALKSDAESFKWDIDYVHAAIHSYEIGKAVEVNRYHQRTGAIKREGYLDSIAYLLDVLPKTEEVTEYHTLYDLTASSLHNEIKQRRREEKFSENSYSLHQASIKDY